MRSQSGEMLNSDDNPILVLDSGLGGLSVLRQIRKYAPGAACVYYGDTAYAPYGSRTTVDVRERVLNLCEDLVGRICPRALVVACNTATSAAIQELRARFSKIPVIGTEPALKPAIEYTSTLQKGGRILVMATPVTLREEKFRDLLERFGSTSDIELLPAPGLVEIIESCRDVQKRSEEYLRALRHEADRTYSAIVLGCTHFPIVKPAIRNVFGSDVRFFDGGDGVARRVIQLVPDLTDRQSGARNRFLSSSPDAVGEFAEKCQTILDLLARES